MIIHGRCVDVALFPLSAAVVNKTHLFFNCEFLFNVRLACWTVSSVGHPCFPRVYYVARCTVGFQ